MKKDKRKYSLERDGNCIYFSYKGGKTKLNCGLYDDLNVYREGDDFFIVAMNNRLEYIGFDLVSSKDGNIIQDIFFQNTEEIHPKFWELSDNYKADLIAQWIQ